MYQVEIKFKNTKHNGEPYVDTLYKNFSNYNNAVEFYHKYDNKEFVEKRYFRAKLGKTILYETDKGTTL